MKKYFFYEPVLDYDLILLPGPYHKEEFVKRFNLQKDDKRFKVVGWPSTDDLACSSYDRNKIMKEAGLVSINIGIETNDNAIAKINKRKLVKESYQEEIIEYCNTNHIFIASVVKN